MGDNTTSQGHALCASGYSYTASSSSTSIEWLIDSGASYHMAKDQAMFSTMHECNTKQIFVGDDRSLRVVESRTVPVENDHFNDVLCVPKISYNLLSVYQITHSGEGKNVTFTPHQVVIKDFKNPQNVLATGTVMILPGFINLTTLGHHLFLQLLLLIVITWAKFDMSDLVT